MAFTPFITRAENEVLTNELIDLRLTGSTGGALFGVTDNQFTADRAVDFDNKSMTWANVSGFTVSGSSELVTFVDPGDFSEYEFVPDLQNYFGKFEDPGSCMYVYNDEVKKLDSIIITIMGVEYTYPKGTVNGGQVVFKSEQIFNTETQADNYIADLPIRANIKFDLGVGENISNFVSVDDSGRLFKNPVTPQLVFGNGGEVNVVSNEYKALSFSLTNSNDGTTSSIGLSNDGSVSIFGESFIYNYNPVPLSLSYDTDPSNKFYPQNDGNIIIPSPSGAPTLDAVVKQGDVVTNYGSLTRYELNTTGIYYQYDLPVQTGEYYYIKYNNKIDSRPGFKSNPLQIQISTTDVNSNQQNAYLNLDTRISNGLVTGGWSIGSDNSFGGGYISYNQDGTSGIVVGESMRNKGMEYYADYSANFTERSLVDKAYVDSVAGVDLNSVINNGSNASLVGGTLAIDVVVDGNPLSMSKFSQTTNTVNAYAINDDGTNQSKANYYSQTPSTISNSFGLEGFVFNQQDSYYRFYSSIGGVIGDTFSQLAFTTSSQESSGVASKSLGLALDTRGFSSSSVPTIKLSDDIDLVGIITKADYSDNQILNDNALASTLAVKKLIALKPYKIYTALLTQTGTNAPVVTELENNIGVITWVFNDTGSWDAQSSTLFTSDKTVIFVSPANDAGRVFNVSNYSTSAIELQQRDSAGAPINDFNSIAIEIRVYN